MFQYDRFEHKLCVMCDPNNYSRWCVSNCNFGNTTIFLFFVLMGFVVWYFTSVIRYDMMVIYVTSFFCEWFGLESRLSSSPALHAVPQAVCCTAYVRYVVPLKLKIFWQIRSTNFIWSSQIHQSAPLPCNNDISLLLIDCIAALCCYDNKWVHCSCEPESLPSFYDVND